MQFDRLAVMYLGDIEVWRTSTAEPKRPPGIHWTYWKDMTTYLSLWQQPQKLIFDLGNIVDGTYTGAFNTTLTATFFHDDVPGPGAEPASLILPISSKQGGSGAASAFSYPQDDTATDIAMPRTAVRAVVSLAATGQKDEEFWWANVPEDVAEAEGDEMGGFPSADSFREVRLLIDGQVAGAAWPFPVVFTGGISPPLHRPLVGIQAFDLLESEIDITPWLGVLCDDKDHEFSIQVVGPNDTKPSSYWVVSGKVFVYLDPKNGHNTTGPAPTVRMTTPDVDELRNYQEGDDDVVSYAQAMRRTIEVAAPVTIRGKEQNATWTQRFSMTNTGWLKNGGNFQAVRANYEGESRAGSDEYTYFYNGFRYPIESTMDSEERRGVTKLQSDLYQGMDMTVTGETVFSGGVDAFLNALDRKVSGSTLSTSRNGTATLYQGANGTSVGDSMSHQTYKFGGRRLMETTGQKFDPYPLLYSREVKVDKERRVLDAVYVYNSDYKSPAPNARAPSKYQAAGDFAPIPNLGRRGGIKMKFGKTAVSDSQSVLAKSK